MKAKAKNIKKIELSEAMSILNFEDIAEIDKNLVNEVKIYCKYNITIFLILKYCIKFSSEFKQKNNKIAVQRLLHSKRS